MPIRIAVLALTSAITVGLFSAPPQRPLRSRDAPILSRIEFVKAIGASQRMLLADYYWLMTIQHVGKARNQSEYRDGYFYADHATSFDPQFYQVYPFTAVGITFNLGREQWVNTDESTRIIRKGLKRFPRDRSLRFLLAFNLMYYERQYAEAARLVEELSKEPDAPTYLAPLATRLYAQGGDFEVGLQLAQGLRDGAEDDETRAFFEHRILEIHLERVLQEVDAASRAYQERHGKIPPSIDILIAQGLLAQAPQDPLDGEIFIDERGRGQSTAVSDRLRLIHAQPQFIQDP